VQAQDCIAVNTNGEHGPEMARLDLARLTATDWLPRLTPVAPTWRQFALQSQMRRL
jgi:hypothetical protein